MSLPYWQHQVGFCDSAKHTALARAAEIKRDAAVVAVSRLFEQLMLRGSNGDLSRTLDEDIALWCGNAKVTLAALKKAGWVEKTGCVHTWDEIYGELVERRAQARDKKRRQRAAEKAAREAAAAASRGDRGGDVPGTVPGTSPECPAPDGRWKMEDDGDDVVGVVHPAARPGAPEPPPADETFDACFERPEIAAKKRAELIALLARHDLGAHAARVERHVASLTRGKDNRASYANSILKQRQQLLEAARRFAAEGRRRFDERRGVPREVLAAPIAGLVAAEVERVAPGLEIPKAAAS